MMIVGFVDDSKDISNVYVVASVAQHVARNVAGTTMILMKTIYHNRKIFTCRLNF